MATQKSHRRALAKKRIVLSGSVDLWQPSGIHIHRRQAIQRGEIIPDFSVIAAQEFVGSRRHVDVIGLTLAAFSVKKLKDWFICRGGLE